MGIRDQIALKIKRGRPDRIEPPLFWFFHSEVFLRAEGLGGLSPDYYRIKGKKEPAIDIAGLCLPLKPQKERLQIFFH
jgi:hypothetical protein